MTKKALKKLAELSYNKDLLDEKKVNTVVQALSRKELKTYIRSLQEIEKKKEVYVTSAKTLTAKDKQTIEALFTDKKVLYTVDPLMISGIRVVQNDQEYEINLEKTFDTIVTYLSTQ